jgi:hypothetical protein
VLRTCATIVGLSSSLGLGCPSAPDEPAKRESWSGTRAPTATLPPMDEIQRKWLEGTRSAVAVRICEEGGFFRECFAVSAEDCSRQFLGHWDACVAKMPHVLPKPVNRETGEHAGRELGTCAGAAYEIALRDGGKYTGQPKCDDPLAWIPK